MEIGAGTGYNAALLAHLTGPSGQVTTLDIDSEVTAQARQSLNKAGYHHVKVINRDGTRGQQEHAPYDRMIVTVGAWDIPTAWHAQLAPDARLVVPLRWRGQTRSIAFIRDGNQLRSDSVELCGFVPMIGQHGERSGYLDPDGLVALYWDADQSIDPTPLAGILTESKTEVWSGTTIGAYDPFDGVWLNLTATEPTTCRIAAEQTAVDTGLCTPAIASRSPALVESASLAYLTLRRLDQDSTERRSELGAIGHGPAGHQLAQRLCEQIQTWDYSRMAQPTITVHAANIIDKKLPEELVIHKHDTTLVVSSLAVRGE